MPNSDESLLVEVRVVKSQLENLSQNFNDLKQALLTGQLSDRKDIGELQRLAAEFKGALFATRVIGGVLFIIMMAVMTPVVTMVFGALPRQEFNSYKDSLEADRKVYKDKVASLESNDKAQDKTLSQMRTSEIVQSVKDKK